MLVFPVPEIFAGENLQDSAFAKISFVRMVLFRNEEEHNMTEICLVPGHACLRGDNPLDEKDWILEPFQQDGGHHLGCFVAHIRVGLAWLETNPDGRLIFTGGLTRPGATRSEAESYLLAAQKLGLISDRSLLHRIVLDEFARDSMENVLYGVAAAFAAVRTRITRVVAVGFEFKRSRFLDHFSAIQLGPGTSYDYFGINNPLEPQLSKAIVGEANTRKAFASKSPEAKISLQAKREARTFGDRRVPYIELCREWPALHASLVQWTTENP